jgi:hypothetical protein
MKYQKSAPTWTDLLAQPKQQERKAYVSNMQDSYKSLVHTWDERRIQFLSEYLKGRHRLGNFGGDARIILKWILEERCLSIWTGYKWLSIGPNDKIL